jgi:hypothetical protein
MAAALLKIYHSYGIYCRHYKGVRMLSEVLLVISRKRPTVEEGITYILRGTVSALMKITYLDLAYYASYLKKVKVYFSCNDINNK